MSVYGSPALIPPPSSLDILQLEINQFIRDEQIATAVSSGNLQHSGAFPRFYDSEKDETGSLVFTPSNEGGAPQSEAESPQLHDGPSGPPCFPLEIDDSLARKLGQERAISDPDASTAFEDRLLVSKHGEKQSVLFSSLIEFLQRKVVDSKERGAAQETRGSTHVSNSTASGGPPNPMFFV